MFLEPHSKCFKFLLKYLQCFPFPTSLFTFSVFRTHRPICSILLDQAPPTSFAATLLCCSVSFIFTFQADWSSCCSLGTDFTFLPLCLCSCSVFWENIPSFSFLIQWNPSSNASLSLTPLISIQHKLFYLGTAIGICWNHWNVFLELCDHLLLYLSHIICIYLFWKQY